MNHPNDQPTRADLLAENARLREALASIERKNTYWITRHQPIGADTIIVEDDSVHHSVRILGEFGAVAHRVLTTPSAERLGKGEAGE